MKIKDFARVQGGYAFKSDNFIANEVPIIRIGNLDGTSVNIEEDTCYTEKFWDEHPEFRVNNGDVLIAMSGATVGKTGRYEHERKALLNQRVCSLLPKENIEKDYLYYFCLSPVFKRQIQENAFGCAQPNISGKQIEEFAINVPDIHEQKKSVELFEKLSDLIVLRKNQLDELDNLVKSRFIEMFGDPIFNPNNNNIKSVGTLVQEGLIDKPLDGNHGEIHPKSSDFVSEGVPFIMANDLNDGKVNYHECHFITEEQSKTLRKGFSKPGDVLLTHKGTIGRTAIVGNEFETIILTPQVTYYRIFKGLNNIYLENYFKTSYFQGIIGNIAGIGSTRAYIGITAQNELPIMIPPIELQNQFASFVQQVDKQKFVLQQSLDEIQTLFNSLMQKYFG